MGGSPSLVFIVGAGASKDFGSSMPVGSELALRIEELLNEEFSRDGINGPISHAFSLDGGYGVRHRQAADRIRRAIHTKESIDDLLEEWREDEIILQVGKAAIACAIQRGECLTALGKCGSDVNAYLDCIGTLRDTWLGQLVRFVQPRQNRRQLGEWLKDIGFVIFNYDRCVEHILVGELVCNTPMDLAQAREYVASMNIVHPYGSLGTAHGPSTLSHFGTESAHLARLGSGIRTYTEERHDGNDLARMVSILKGAKTTVFLGFGYHPKNMSLLMNYGLNTSGTIYGACIKPDRARLVAAHRLLFRGGTSNRLHDIGCREFMTAQRARIFGSA